MNFHRKNPKADLRTYYPVFFEGGLIIVLLIFIAAVKMDIPSEQANADLTTEQEVVQMEEVIQTKQEEKPPPPPRPQVPVEVPDDEIVEDVEINLDADMNLEDPLAMPPPPDQAEEEENFFVSVEEMPQLKGGLASIQQCVNYPEQAQRAGIEGRVIVQFIVNEDGEVEENNTKVVRGIGGGADEEAVRCVKEAEFKPGMQRGQTVRVQFSLPVVYNLSN